MRGPLNWLFGTKRSSGAIGGSKERPLARVEYILQSCGSGFYDIADGGVLVGSVQHNPGGQDRYATWTATVYGVTTHFWSFDTAKEWLGSPLVKRKRSDAQ